MFKGSVDDVIELVTVVITWPLSLVLAIGFLGGIFFFTAPPTLYIDGVY